jgi:hypothetical protein
VDTLTGPKNGEFVSKSKEMSRHGYCFKILGVKKAGDYLRKDVRHETQIETVLGHLCRHRYRPREL